MNTDSKQLKSRYELIKNKIVITTLVDKRPLKGKIYDTELTLTYNHVYLRN
jgi:hypothetical protein